MQRKDLDGFAIALAWPETFCKQAGAWYDILLMHLGINQKGYYKAGHAAVVLVQNSTGICHYFDFGRYHAPFGHGRVRNVDTDPELKINAIAQINGEEIKNIKTILNELSERKACHGNGVLFASLCKINFEKAMRKATSLQNKSPLPYGPFKYKGTNCSRFVHAVILSGIPRLDTYISLSFPYTLTPSPLSNIKALKSQTIIKTGKMEQTLSCRNLLDVLPPPPMPKNLSPKARWLAGEGAGSWFCIIKKLNHFLISRYTEEGNLEFASEYKIVNSAVFKPSQKFQILYLSHYLKVSILQDSKVIEFEKA